VPSSVPIFLQIFSRYLTGCRTLETHLYKPGSYPFDLIAPITILWRAVSVPKIPAHTSQSNGEVALLPELAGEAATNDTKRKRKRKGKSKGKEKEREQETQPAQGSNQEMHTHSSQEDTDNSRIVWIHSHPAAFDNVFSTLQSTASLSIDAIRRGSKEPIEEPLDVELEDLRGQVNVFEIMGPKSSQVIKGALTPVAEDKRDEFKKVCGVC
jgi:ribonuclease P/MRP protein subunit POP1